ncbi:hypothetical protein B0H17DRAFT_1077314 [Mycena rosella]|uniref:Uncharacterized protein n=1 Tax=Mycena rosella TaxID=1033263 RepID=A0AAD7D5M0_MYCRO|nr:hypothetical protein B0H17DRAFT_1077314 [Mycena rosella]
MPTHKHAFSVSSPPLTPLSPTMSITINTPLSTPPSSSGLGRSFTSAKDMRRRHMAKLTRTLGENIAPELVVADPVAPRLTRAKSIAALHDAPAPPPSMRPLKSPTLGRSASMRHLDSATLGRSFSTVSHNSRIMLVPTSHRRGESIAFTSANIAADLLAAKEARDADAARLDLAVRQLSDELRAGRGRKEKEWSGEWNREMQAVAKQLRSLK